jgi:PAS domain S-box-containing protein
MDKHKEKFQDLRNKAEELLVKNKNHPTVVKTEFDELIHELEVYQIELEMQNEEYIKSQIKLEESRDDYIELYDFAPVGYFTLNQDGIITRVNLTGSDLLGVPRKYLNNSAFIRFIAPDYRKIFYDNCQKVGKSELKNHCEVELLSKNNNKLFASLDTAKMVDDEGIFTEYRIIVTDITETKKAETALQESIKRENFLAELLESSEQPFGVVNPDGSLGYVNGAFERLIGYTKEELKSFDWMLVLTPPEFHAMEQEKLEEVQRTDQPVIYEKEYIRKDGTRVPIELLVHLKRNNDGTPQYYYSFITDITERKKSEFELRRSNDRLNIASCAAGAGIWDWNIKTGQLEWSPVMFDLFGLDPTKTKASFAVWENILHPDDLEMASKNIERAIEEHTFLDNQYRIVLPDGQIKWINALGQTEYDHHGLPKWMMGICIDITQRKQTDIKLKETLDNLEKLVDERTTELNLSNEYNRNLIETSLDPLVTIGPDGMITDVNRATENITGYARGEIVGSDFANYFTKPREAEEGYQLVFQEGMVRDYPLEIKHKNGNITPVMYNAAVYKDGSGEVVGVFAAARDVTKLKKAEEELREYWESLEEQVELRTEELAKRTEELANSNADLNQFVYAASHDLREPLRMITSFLQLLERRYKDQLDHDANEFIGFAVDGAKRLDYMIKDLLEYSRVANKEMMFSDVYLGEVLEQIKLNLKVLINENKAIISYDQMPLVKGDEYQMILLFQNIIGNAIKYRREEAPRIHISVLEDGDKYLFSVKGIDSEHLEGIFNIFNRLHTHEKYEGTGIGLSIAQRIVHQHGGEIWAESEPGESSTFYFTIPMDLDYGN